MVFHVHFFRENADLIIRIEPSRAFSLSFGTISFVVFFMNSILNKFFIIDFVRSPVAPSDCILGTVSRILLEEHTDLLSLFRLFLHFGLT